MHKKLFSFLKLRVNSKFQNLHILSVLQQIRFNQFVEIWYLSDGGRINKVEGFTLTSFRGNFSLIFIKEQNSDRIFGFTPTSPRLVLIR